MIKKEFLHRGDLIIFEDNSKYWIRSKKAIINMKIIGTPVKVFTFINKSSPRFIGFVKDKDTNEKKIVFWITDKQKIATSRFRRSSKDKNTYNVLLWEKRK